MRFLVCRGVLASRSAAAPQPYVPYHVQDRLRQRRRPAAQHAPREAPLFFSCSRGSHQPCGPRSSAENTPPSAAGHRGKTMGSGCASMFPRPCPLPWYGAAPPPAGISTRSYRVGGGGRRCGQSCWATRHSAPSMKPSLFRSTLSLYPGCLANHSSQAGPYPGPPAGPGGLPGRSGEAPGPPAGPGGFSQLVPGPPRGPGGF
jgi:hypothetical protein